MIIEFLVLNDSQKQEHLLHYGRQLFQHSQNLQHVFRVLMAKFKKLKKTKEEMVKYCMRKAFKYMVVSDNQKSKISKSKRNGSPQKQLGFEIPFRKNSSEKTMNAQFLKQTFANPEFLAAYTEFLGRIKNIIQEDNQNKIQYLSESIQKILKKDEIKQVQGIKRLPWTKTILKRTQQLALTLMDFASPDMSLDKFDISQNI